MSPVEIIPAEQSHATLPLQGYIRLYEASLKGENKSAKTIQVYLYVLGRFHDWLEVSYDATPVLGYFTVAHVRLFLAAALERPKWDGHPFMQPAHDKHISGSTLHQYVRTLKTFGNWLAREGYTPTHTLYSLRLPKVEEKQLLPLTEEEERKLIGSYDDNNAADCRIKAIFLLMLDTGLRLSEVIHLQDANLDLDNGFLLVMGKGRKERSVPFGFTTERVLRKYVTFFRPQSALPNIGEFFLSPEGYALSKKALEMVFVRARTRTGLGRLHPHLLRHTYGIRAQENDMPTITLQHYMGHTSSKVTERYVHAAQSEKLKRARGYSPVDQLGIRSSHPTRRYRPGR